MPGPRRVRLNAEELGFPAELQTPLETLLANINPFFNDTAQALDRRLTVGGNLASAYKEVTATVPNLVWTTPTLENSWVAFGGSGQAPGYRIDETGAVWLRGSVKNGTAIATTICTLPAGYRPAATRYFSVDSNGAFGSVTVASSGAVAGVAGSTAQVSLDQVYFDASSPEALAPYSGTGWPIKIATGFTQHQARHVWLVQTTDTATGDRKTNGACLPTWRRGSGGQILVDRIHGLTPGRTYRLAFLILGETT